MNNDKIALTMQDILEKDFKIDTRGYRMQEVDEFLDTIIRDYNEYNSIIKKLTEDNIPAQCYCLLVTDKGRFS